MEVCCGKGHAASSDLLILEDLNGLFVQAPRAPIENVQVARISFRPFNLGTRSGVPLGVIFESLGLLIL